MFSNMGVHIIDFPSGRFGFVGSLPPALGDIVAATAADIMAGRAFSAPDGTITEMLEEFQPMPPRTLATCMTLRRAGYRPYARLSIYGRKLECISYPFPQDGAGIRGGGAGIGIMLREPDDPTSMFEWSIPRNIVRMSIETFGA